MSRGSWMPPFIHQRIVVYLHWCARSRSPFGVVGTELSSRSERVIPSQSHQKKETHRGPTHKEADRDHSSAGRFVRACLVEENNHPEGGPCLCRLVQGFLCWGKAAERTVFQKKKPCRSILASSKRKNLLSRLLVWLDGTPTTKLRVG